ncbi:A/G-specific adenine glycosylase [Ruficoccus sp. ZRK36]|uniref:A/G-specific adenine glycosylase n=1 Tax=Ruficoccus sp. ZRK36 TaxID=2866311 RepID=UPI0021039295|nr:A/G-specific adenine glycosylase [Ruficoccus sp. ZRK36]
MSAPDVIRNHRAFQAALGRWYEQNHRKLPWRTQPSLYRTVVSEFMLQQTQVNTVLPYFDAWMKQFPDFEALAAADEDTVVKAWEGLGYYRRARNLLALARAYVDADPKPVTASEWQALPGVGPYTAAAIASISHHEEIAVIDGNVVRILTRILDDRTAYKDASQAARQLVGQANQLIKGASSPGDHNQAMMELGATVCTRGNPLCPLCPVQAYCRSHLTGEAELLPIFAKRNTVYRQINRCWLERDGKLLLQKAPSDSARLAGMHELPEGRLLKCDYDKAPLILSKKRGIANELIEERIYALAGDTPVPDSPHLLWADIDELDQLTLSGPHRRWVSEILGTRKQELFPGA